MANNCTQFNKKSITLPGCILIIRYLWKDTHKCTYLRKPFLSSVPTHWRYQSFVLINGDIIQQASQRWSCLVYRCYRKYLAANEKPCLQGILTLMENMSSSHDPYYITTNRSPRGHSEILMDTNGIKHHQINHIDSVDLCVAKREYSNYIIRID